MVRKTEKVLVDFLLCFQRVCKWMVQMLLALDYLHSNRVLHRNLKVSNVWMYILYSWFYLFSFFFFGFSQLFITSNMMMLWGSVPTYSCQRKTAFSLVREPEHFLILNTSVVILDMKLPCRNCLVHPYIWRIFIVHSGDFGLAKLLSPDGIASLV